MTKFARINIIWQRGAFLTAVVLDSEHYTFISDIFAIREDEHPGLLFFRTSLKKNASFLFSFVVLFVLCLGV